MTMNKSIELFRNTILETFAGLHKPTRIKRATKVTKGLEKLKNKEKRNPRINPGDEENAANKLDMIGQPALAAGVRGGVFTNKNSGKPTAAKRHSKHIQKRGAEGEHDVRLAKGLENKEKQNEDITTAEKKDIKRRSGGNVAKKHELLKKRIERAIAARQADGDNRSDEASKARKKRLSIEKKMSPHKLRVDVAGRRARAAQAQADQTGQNVDFEAGEGPKKVTGQATPSYNPKPRRG